NIGRQGRQGLGVLGQGHGRQPDAHSGQGRRLVGAALHHGEDVLHGYGAAGADGRSGAGADGGEDQGWEVRGRKNIEYRIVNIESRTAKAKYSPSTFDIR